jgi:hypothetical protein
VSWSVAVNEFLGRLAMRLGDAKKHVEHAAAPRDASTNEE